MTKLKDYARYILCIALLFIVFAIYGVRLAKWQLIEGKEFLQRANRTNTTSVKMEATRGEILDVNGTPLAINKTAYNILLDKSKIDKDKLNETILKLTQLLKKLNQPWIDELPIAVDSKGNYSFIKGMEKQIAVLKGKDALRLNSYATAKQCMDAMIKKYKCEAYSPIDIRTIVSVRYNMDRLGFSLSTPYLFAENVSQNNMIIASESSQIIPGIEIKISTSRQYPNGIVAPHVIGVLGALSQEEYTSLKSSGKTYSLNNIIGYAFNDKIGKNGIEQAFENQLRGKNGEKVVEATNTGTISSIKITQAPVAGNTVYLSLDSRIQQVAEVSLEKNIKATQENGRGSEKKGADCVAGGVVVLNVKDFSVLAAATYPNYDLSKYTTEPKYYLSLIQDNTRPLFNRAFNGSFMPGSAFKPVVATAGLQENVINQSSTIFCGHYYERFAASGYRPSCMGYHHNINVIHALQKSCNIFFFDTGWNLGINTINLYAKRYGLGQKTGLEINESAGTLAGPEERKAKGGTWVGGDVIQASIGQSDNAFTPVQLASYVATIANNGVRLQTHLVKKVTDYSRKNVVLENKESQPNIVDNLNVSPQTLDLVKQGMREVCLPGGTASSFANYGIAVAGKTGTAENPPHSDNVVFIGFAPYDKPEIAVAVVLEYGATGKYSTAVARDVFDAYFYKKRVDASGNLVIPSAADALNSSSTPSSSSASSQNAQ